MRAALTFQSLPFASAYLIPIPSHQEPSSIKHNERHSHPLARPRFATNPAQSHRPPAQLANALCFTPAQAAEHTTNTFATPGRALSQHRRHHLQTSKAPDRPRFNSRGRRPVRQRCHCRTQGHAALLRHDFHLQEVSRTLVASHHKAGLPLWHRLGELPWMQEQAFDR